MKTPEIYYKSQRDMIQKVKDTSPIDPLRADILIKLVDISEIAHTLCETNGIENETIAATIHDHVQIIIAMFTDGTASQLHSSLIVLTESNKIMKEILDLNTTPHMANKLNLQ